MARVGRLLFGASETCADMYYATGLYVPDPIVWCEVGNERLVIVSPLEYGRFSAGVREMTRVLSYKQARQMFKLRNLRAANQIAGLTRFFGVRRWRTGADFPLGLARALERRGVRVAPVRGPLFPERECKREVEVRALEDGVRLAEAGLAAALTVIREARLNGVGLVWRGRPLTAEVVRGEIDATISRLGGLAAHTIVAAGRHGADPHDGGAGPIAPNEPIVIDIFPRVHRHGYFGDLTRTVVKGQASDVVRRAFAAVRAARDHAKTLIRPGVNGKDVHAAVVKSLTDAGFATDANAAPPHGFFHGTGHGLGLEIHEAPRLSQVASELKEGHVVTVEPGLYYPEWGGMRLEDVVVVTADGCRTLTRVPDELEIP